MSRKYHIRWQKSDSQDLSKAIKNFNAKISRLEKKYPELKNALPEKARLKGYTDENGNYIPGLKDLINTRQDLKREINSLKRFTDKSNKIQLLDNGSYEGIVRYGNYNINVTKWQIKEFNRRRATINTRRKKRLDALLPQEVTSRGEPQGYTISQIGVGSLQANNLSPMKELSPGSSALSIKKQYMSAVIQSQSDFLTLSDYRAKSSYITGLYRNFNADEIQDIIKAVEEMPVEQWLHTFQTDADAKFEGLYPGNKRQEKQYADSLRAVWLPKR